MDVNVYKNEDFSQNDGNLYISKQRSKYFKVP